MLKIIILKKSYKTAMSDLVIDTENNKEFIKREILNEIIESIKISIIILENSYYIF